jgi:hypothetical protein
VPSVGIGTPGNGCHGKSRDQDCARHGLISVIDANEASP